VYVFYPFEARWFVMKPVSVKSVILSQPLAVDYLLSQGWETSEPGCRFFNIDWEKPFSWRTYDGCTVKSLQPNDDTSKKTSAILFVGRKVCAAP
jgi:hypothetical protein